MDMTKYEEEYVEINGVNHYFLHYRKDADAPVLLFIHGGPGSTESMIAYLVEAYEERNYSIVYYDQRGTGKTYLKSKLADANMVKLQEDLLQIVLHIKKKYKKEKVGILGHSFGTSIGSLFALKYSEHVLFYIGCGQMIDTYGGECYAFEKLKKAIEEAGNEKDKQKLKTLGTYPMQQFDKKMLGKMRKIRALQGKYHLAGSIDKKMLKIIRKSPIMGLKDWWPLMVGVMKNMEVMKDLMEYNLRKEGTNFQIPMYFVMGEEDEQTPIALVKQFYEEIDAPKKEFFTIKNAGHYTMIDNVKVWQKTMVHIVNDNLK